MSKFARKGRPPPGFEVIAGTLEALEIELREKVNESHEGKRKTESLWPVHQINWQRSRYVFDLYYKYQKISKQVYDYCILNKIVDAALIAKWKKPGYERICSTYVINTKNYKFGTVSICRVPKQFLGAEQVVECPVTGCLGCASGPGGQRNIFGNKYGQYLGAIQVARETRAKLARQAEEGGGDDGAAAAAADGGDDDDGATASSGGGGKGKGKKRPPADSDDDDDDGAKGKKSCWAVTDEEQRLESIDPTTGNSLDAEREAKATAASLAKGGGQPVGGGGGGRPIKRGRN